MGDKIQYCGDVIHLLLREQYLMITTVLGSVLRRVSVTRLGKILMVGNIVGILQQWSHISFYFMGATF